MGSEEEPLDQRIAIAFIRREAAKMAKTEHYEFLHLAAYIFAFASSLNIKRDEVLKPSEPAGSLREISRRLAHLPYDLEKPALYIQLIEALLTVEAELCRHETRDDRLPSSTRLKDIAEDRGGWLTGVVYHWLRPESALARKRDQRYESAVKRRPRRPREHPMDHLLRLAMYWASDDQMPDLVPPRADFGRVIPLVDESSHDIIERECFRVALCPLQGDFHPQFDIVRSGHRFRAHEPEGIKNYGELCTRLTWLLKTAAQEKIHLLVLPELTVPLKARDLIAQALRENPSNFPYGVLAGSFHIWRRDLLPESQSPVNEAQLLDHTGRSLLTHWKKGEFRVPSSKAKPPFFPSELPDRLEPELLEDIEEGMKLEVLETSLGRIVVLICADAIALDPNHSYLLVIRRLRPDLLFIVSMSPETEPFERFLKEMSENWIGSLFVNAHCICSPLGQETKSASNRVLLASSDLALYEPLGAAPTRMRWDNGSSEAEPVFHGPGDKKWPGAVSPLREGDRNLGVVLNLGAHWAQDA